MITSSPATGGGSPPHVLAALQFPDWELVLVAANKSVPRNKISTNVKRVMEKYFFMIASLLKWVLQI
jgi:hypothetical protein